MKEGLEKDTKKSDSVTVKDGETNPEVGKKKGKEERPPTKVVVRRLPPTMTEEEFLQQIEPLPPVDYMYYVPADLSLSPNAFCRAYLNFVKQSDIFIFTQKFDGYVFVDSKGQEYPAVVEFAPFQRIPKQRPGRKKDPKAGTIESDPTYTSFLEKLNAQMQENTSAGSNIKQHFFETNVSSSEDNKVSSTPLLDYLRSRHAERLRAREEKRKKDLERKRAREEQRRTAKKSEEELAVLKVLPSHTSSSKDKFKEKDHLVKPIKKRSDERIKETKGRVGKSYAEERQKQLEKREEQRKKFSSSSISTKPAKAVKLSTDKSSEQISTEPDKNQDSESKKTESDPKISDDTKKESYAEKKSYQHKYSQDSQKHYEYSKRDDDVKRRSRDTDRVNRMKEQYHDRREDRDRMRRKTTGDSKRGYGRYDDYNKDKYRKDHYSSRKEGPNSSVSDKKVENEVKKGSVVSDSASIAKESKNENVTDVKPKESVSELAVKQDDAVSKENSSKLTESVESNLISDSSVKKEISESVETPEELKDSGQTIENSGELLESSVESDEKKSSLCSKEKIESKNESAEFEIQHSSSDSSSAAVESSREVDSEKSENLDINKAEETSENPVQLPVNETDTLCPSEENSEKVDINFDSERASENESSSNLRNQKMGETVLKRRNSMENYERKSENSDNNNRRENARRSSLESGDQHANSRQLEEEKNEKKKSEGDSCDSKPKDPRTERRIRNKDRPSIEIYRPGMGRFSKQRLEREKVLGSSTEVDSNSPSPSPTLVPKHKSTLINHS